MADWWMQKRPEYLKLAHMKRAVAYYRHSAEIGQENSVEIQRENVRAFAAKHGIEITKEFADPGKSGLNAEGRPGFNAMMKYVRDCTDFKYVFVLDVSRWGRFQDTDLSAHYKALCTKEQKQVIYANIGFPKEEEALIYSLRESIDRYQAAEYSRVLSKKVFDGQAKVAKQGYRPGGSPPYGFNRLMLNERKQPDRVLQPGQRKAIQNGRVILIPGTSEHVSIVQEIFLLFVEKNLHERQIAGQLNHRGILSPGGRQWSDATVRHVLTNQQYAGAVVFNKTTKRLKSRTRRNPVDEWVITPGAYEHIIEPQTFERAQAIFNNRKRRLEPNEMLRRLKALYEQYAIVTSKLIQFDTDAPSASAYCSRFGSLNGAFQHLFDQPLKKAKDDVVQKIGAMARLINEHDDFLVIDETLTVLIQPSVPTPSGYDSYWEFRPDARPEVDITLGVPLSDDDNRDILGYLVLPRLMVHSAGVRLSVSSTAQIELYAHSGLDFLQQLMG